MHFALENISSGLLEEGCKVLCLGLGIFLLLDHHLSSHSCTYYPLAQDQRDRACPDGSLLVILELSYSSSFFPFFSVNFSWNQIQHPPGLDCVDLS